MAYRILQKLASSRSAITRHALVWSIFIAYEMAYVRFTAGVNASLFHFSIYYLLNIALFYFNAHVVLNFAFFNTSKPYLVAFLLIIPELFVYLLIKFSMDFFLADTHHSLADQLLHTQRFIVINIWRGIYFLGFSVAYFSMIYMMAFKEANHRSETGHLKTMAKNLELANNYMIAENAYLQAQISPHLVFNSLNFIYNSVHRVSEKAGKGIILLADLMRYALGTGKGTVMVLLDEEVLQVENLIRLNQLRFEHDLHLNFTRQEYPEQLKIIPLILVTLVENMIKHGDLGEPEQPGLIELNYTPGQLTFRTLNKKRISTPYPKGGLGLTNIKQRLNNHYPGQHNLSINDAEEIFILILILYL